MINEILGILVPLWLAGLGLFLFVKEGWWKTIGFYVIIGFGIVSFSYIWALALYTIINNNGV